MAWCGIIVFQGTTMHTAMANALKSLLLATATAVAALSLTNAARAEIVLVGGTPESAFVDLGAEGFGAAPLLTLQTNTLESGGVTPIDVLNGDAVAGGNKPTTPTLGTAPIPGAALLFGSGLFGGLGASTWRKRRRSRGAVSLLA
jgi:hypothetical protein